ncbi:MAG: hypothetical protein SNG27_04785 [Rikenellaceae bacterium]
MNLRIAFIVAITLAISSSCRELPLNFGGDKILASVGDKTLRLSDVWVNSADGMSPEDSVSFVRHQTERWIQNSVKLQESERLFASSSNDVDALVEEYRNTLMVKKLEKNHISQTIVPPIEDEQIEEYYTQNGENFRLNTRLVKGRIVILPKDYKTPKEIKTQMETIADKKGGDFKSICEKSGVELIEFTTSWVEYGDFMNRLPIVRSGDYSEYTDALGEVHQLDGRNHIYFFQFIDVLNIGDTEPIERVREKILYILNNKNQAELLKKYDSLLMQTAINKGYIRNYTISDKE